jgi:alginate O-acetyltransferase complex protein AlgI
MSFSSISFLSLLPPFVLLYWTIRNQTARNSILIAFSIGILSFNSLYDFITMAAILLYSSVFFFLAKKFPNRRKSTTVAAIISLATILVISKLKIEIFHEIFALLSLSDYQNIHPIGLSYYIFILVGFFIEINRNPATISSFSNPQRLIFFPTVFSGPIVRHKPWSAQYSSERKLFALKNITIGSQIFAVGFLKKIFIADPIGYSISPVFDNPLSYDSISICMALFGFYIQLYADFSGYTDMARGLGRMLGYHLPINFKAPYLAATPLNFWARWHMSLTGWIKDYIFIPMSVQAWRTFGTKRISTFISASLVIALMVLVGLWHGFNANFVIFGVFHGVLVISWYAVVKTGKKMKAPGQAFSWCLFTILLIGSLTLFRSNSPYLALDMLAGIFTSTGTENISDGLPMLLIVTAVTFLLQAFEKYSQIGKTTRTLVALRKNLFIFPVLIAFIFFGMYMTGITLNGVWISPADPFFNQGQEKFIYFKF